MVRKVEISHKTVIFTVFFLLSLGLIYLLKDLIFELFISLLLMTILEPMVNSFTKIKIPRTLSVFLSYVVVFGVLGGTLALIIPALVDQTTSFVNALPIYFSSLGLSDYLNSQYTSELINRLGSLPAEAFKFTVSIFSNVFSVLTVLVFTFYMILSRDKFKDQLGFAFGEDKKVELGNLMDELDARLGGWARGQFMLMFLVGLFTFIGLSILNIPYALPLAILAGILEIVPYLGPIVAAIPSVIIGFSISPVMGFGAAGVAILIQQLENYVLVPKVMEKSVGMSPLVILIALAVGVRLAGVVGAVISVPVLITLHVFAKKYLARE